jgi:hypothetical protein
MHIPVYKNRIEDAPVSVPLFAYESRMLKKYVRMLEKRQRPEVLDLGPVCGNNISFFLDRSSRLYQCDSFSRSVRELKRDSDADEIFSHLEIRENSLDGIHLWDVPDHIDNRTLSLLVNKLHSFLKPDGLLMMIASTSTAAQPSPLYFVIRDDCAVVLERSTSARLSYVYRPNRDIERNLIPFRQVNSFICTNGVREFLFKPKE